MVDDPSFVIISGGRCEKEKKGKKAYEGQKGGDDLVHAFSINNTVFKFVYFGKPFNILK